MQKLTVLFTALGLGVVACADVPTALPGDDLSVSPLFNATGPVVHHVSVGSPDICEALGLPTGCDANFSLAANQKADGSAKGQWQDVFKFGLEHPIPVHVTVDCLNVSGNQAWVSGVVTGPQLAGVPVITRVADNGTSAKDPPDQVSFTFFDEFGGCQAAPDLPLFDLAHGQVRVR